MCIWALYGLCKWLMKTRRCRMPLNIAGNVEHMLTLRDKTCLCDQITSTILLTIICWQLWRCNISTWKLLCHTFFILPQKTNRFEFQNSKNVMDAQTKPTAYLLSFVNEQIMKRGQNMACGRIKIIHLKKLALLRGRCS